MVNVYSLLQATLRPCNQELIPCLMITEPALSRQHAAVFKRMEAVITIGLPGCGKSTWASRLPPEWVRLERDAVRAVLHRDRAGRTFAWTDWDFSREGEVQRAWADALARAIKARARLVVADTNLNTRFRRLLAQQLLEAGYGLRYVFFDVAQETARARNALRANPVQEEAYAKLLPGFSEARQVLASEALELGIQLEVVNN